MSQAKKQKVKLVERDEKGREIVMLDMGTDEKKQEKDMEKDEEDAIGVCYGHGIPLSVS